MSERAAAPGSAATARAKRDRAVAAGGLSSLPNLLGIGRILVTPVIVALVLIAAPGTGISAFLLFAAGALSDIVDGRIARARNSVSRLGVFMDLTADKVLAAAVMVALVEVGGLAAWLAATLIVRELVVQGVRATVAAAAVVIPADLLGKGKNVAVLAGIGLLLLARDAATGGPTAQVAAASALQAAGFWVLVAAAVLSVLSGLGYLRRALPVLLADER